MLSIGIEINGLKELEKYTEFVRKMLRMQTDKKFQDFIKKKCMETLNNVMKTRIISGTTSNDEEISLYMSSNHIEDIENFGFIMYNDAKIPANKYNKLPFDTSGYPNGNFSIALAFEYGVGVVGMGDYGNQHNYKYNAIDKTKSKARQDLLEHGYNGYWYLPKSVYNKSSVLYEGYEGFEIYRHTSIEIQKNLKKWVREYYNKEVLK